MPPSAQCNKSKLGGAQVRVQNHYVRLFVGVILVVMHSGTGHATQSPINRFVAAAVPASPADAAASRQLAAALFEDPTDLALNFELLKRQLAAKDYNQAVMTLDRIQILDPSSRLAKILYAELQFRLGNAAVAKTVLQTLIDDPVTPRVMRDQARAVLSLIATTNQEKPLGITIEVEQGRAGNARAASAHKQLLYQDIAIENTTDDRSESFYNYKVAFDLSHDLMRQIPQSMTISVSFDQRHFRSYQLANSKTYGVDLVYRRGINSALSVSSQSLWTERDNKKYTASSGLTARGQHILGPRTILASSLRATRHVFFDTPSLASHKDQNGAVYSASLGLTKLHDKASFGARFSLSDRQARQRYYGRKTQQLSFYSRFGMAAWQGLISLGRTITKYKAADPLVGRSIRRDRSVTAAAELSQSIATFANGTDIAVTLAASATKTKSTIMNFTRKFNEIRLGTRIKY
jgi:hypothetical protein